MPHFFSKNHNTYITNKFCLRRLDDNKNMNYNNDEDSLDELNRLLERLHQAGYDQHFSHLQIVYVSPGAQHVDKIETQRIGANPLPPASPPTPLQKARGKDNSEEANGLPNELATEAAMELWQKAQEAGYVDEHYQPKLSRTKAALLANAMAERLGIRNKWKVFGTLWKRQKMYRDYYDALNLQQSIEFQDCLKKLFD